MKSKKVVIAFALISLAKKLETTLQLPVQDEQPAPATTSKLPLKIQFSVIPVRADDPSEKAFVQMLRRVSTKAIPADAPLAAYSIYGRGRCLGKFADFSFE